MIALGQVGISITNNKGAEIFKNPGNSGCKIELVGDHQLVVKKTAFSVEYSERLKCQRLKQQRCMVPFPEVVIPRVTDYNEMSFTMERLSMLDAIDFFERAAPSVISARLKVLMDFIQWESNLSIYGEINGDVFLQKLYNIQQALPEKIWKIYYSDYARRLERTIPVSVVLPIGSCHGDLTFSNIMFSISENRIGLIDFLDSFIDSPLVDLVKLRQDTRYHWTSLRYPHEHDVGKIYLTNAWIDQMLTDSFGGLIETYPFWLIEMFNYFRIAPYVRDEQEHDYLRKVLAVISAKEF